MLPKTVVADVKNCIQSVSMMFFGINSSPTYPNFSPITVVFMQTLLTSESSSHAVRLTHFWKGTCTKLNRFCVRKSFSALIR